MNRRSRFVLGFLASLLMVGSVAYAALPPGGTFRDDASVHQGNIEAIAAAGIT